MLWSMSNSVALKRLSIDVFELYLYNPGCASCSACLARLKSLFNCSGVKFSWPFKIIDIENTSKTKYRILFRMIEIVNSFLIKLVNLKTINYGKSYPASLHSSDSIMCHRKERPGRSDFYQNGCEPGTRSRFCFCVL